MRPPTPCPPKKPVVVIKSGRGVPPRLLRRHDISSSRGRGYPPSPIRRHRRQNVKIVCRFFCDFIFTKFFVFSMPKVKGLTIFCRFFCDFIFTETFVFSKPKVKGLTIFCCFFCDFIFTKFFCFFKANSQGADHFLTFFLQPSDILNRASIYHVISYHESSNIRRHGRDPPPPLHPPSSSS